MSRTIRNRRLRLGRRWWNYDLPEPRGDSKPFGERFKYRRVKDRSWTCHCEYCLSNKLHKYARQPQMFDYDGFENEPAFSLAEMSEW